MKKEQDETFRKFREAEILAGQNIAPENLMTEQEIHDFGIDLVYKYSNPENLKITLYNSVGKVLLITKLKGVTTSLNTDKLSSGIYFIQLSKEGKNLTKSFMKR